ncbi:MAG TPA: IclR family transcriptional regulator [Gaiellaceae bacterium]
MNETRNFSLSSIDRAMAILDAFDDQPELQLADVARSAHLSEATALRYAASLTTHGFLERDPASGRYRLGLRLFELGQKTLRRRDPRTIALPHMTRLRDRFAETVTLAMRHGDDLVLIEGLESPHSIRKGAQLGGRDCWHASSLGKAVLAHLSQDDARELLERLERPRYTGNTIISVELLLDHLDVVRAQGFAIDELEAEDELRCVGAAILDRHGSPAYAISIAGPASRLTREVAGEMGAAVREAAAAISAALGYLAPAPPSVDGVGPRESAPA